MPLDLAIIGGGAAGLAAAIFAAESAPAPLRIVILEASAQCGTKILVSGGGRCNVTHRVVTPDDFSGSRNIVRNILAGFTVTQAVAWFESLGVPLVEEETGKLFPASNSARAVRDALVARAKALGTEILTGARVSSLVCSEKSFTIAHAQGMHTAARVILTAGGRSLPRSGADGSGWTLARALGHSVTPTYQALVPLVLDGGFFHGQLSGIALDVELTTLAGGKTIDHRGGAMLFTHFGVSGPAAMDASRHWVTAQEQNLAPQLRCNLLPGERADTIEQWLIEMSAARPRASLLTAVASRLPERVALALLQYAGVAASTQLAQLKRDERRQVAQALTALPLPVLRPRGWDYAEVTAGGVPLSEINYRTMESRHTPGLYLAGEILDCDGRIGGFNFQWAWATGRQAGAAAARSVPASAG
jgi:predicted Rossmann fold flavoprotein